MTVINFLRLKNVSIFEQLQLEEALLRSDDENYTIVNVGSSKSIVMGVSGKKESLVDVQKCKDDNVPLIKRFSGGGTVIVDHDTIFVTFIFNKSLFDFPPFPEPILRWTEGFYQSLTPSIPNFKLIENDYTIDNLKCAGNAQYLTKNRWLHHTTFLWDFSQKNMEYLLYPPKTPQYRKGRSHKDFLCTLNPYYSEKEEFVSSIKEETFKRFNAKEVKSSDFSSLLNKPHRKTTMIVSLA